jgi:Sad1 / UNC-like C-terminal
MSQNPRQVFNKRIQPRPYIDNHAPVHNIYPDLKNKFAPNAIENNHSLFEILFFFIVIFLLGWISSQLIMFVFKTEPETEIKELEIIEPTYTTKIEVGYENIDYAALKNGGSIDKESSSPEYHGIFSFISSNRLESLLSDNNAPENCWPIMGNYGHAGIRLGKEIYPTGFTIVLSKKPTDTSPRLVSVYSLDTDSCYLLAETEIVISPKATEINSSVFFECKLQCGNPTQLILVEINDNYGNENTCMYQFKVHGLPSNI